MQNSQPDYGKVSVVQSFPLVRRPRPMTNIEIAVSGASRAGTIIIAIVALVYALGAWSAFLIPLTAAIVLGLMLSPLVSELERGGLPPWLASLLLVMTLGAVLYLAGMVLAAPVVEGFRSIPDIANELSRRLNALRAPMDILSRMDAAISKVGEGGETVPKVAVKDGSILSGLLAVAPPAIGQIVLFFGALIFFLFTRTNMRSGILRMCLSRPARLRTARIMRDVESNISRYLLTIFCINCGLGFCVAAAMWLLSVPNPVMWGVLAGLLNFLPYIGPIIVTALLAGAGLLTFDSLSLALAPAMAFVCLTTIEGQFFTPGILGRSLTLNPFLVFVSIAFWLWLWGPVGAFMAVPLLILIAVTVSHLLPAKAG